MDTTKRQAADRIRPILAAMERSIDSARRRRLHIDDEHTPQAPVPQPNAAVHEPQATAPPSDKRDELIAVPNRHQTNSNGSSNQPNRTSSDNQQPAPGKARLKARPKRPVGFDSNPNQPFYGAKAG